MKRSSGVSLIAKPEIFLPDRGVESKEALWQQMEKSVRILPVLVRLHLAINTAARSAKRWRRPRISIANAGIRVVKVVSIKNSSISLPGAPGG